MGSSPCQSITSGLCFALEPTFVTGARCKAFPSALSGRGKKEDSGGWGACNPGLGTDRFPYMGTDDGWKWVVPDAFLFWGVHKELSRAWDEPPH